MEPQSYSEGDAEWIFQRFYDFDPDGLLTFNMVTLKREGQGSWSQKVISSRLQPLLNVELVSLISESGFERVTSYGGMDGAVFDPLTSGNLVILANTPS
jgi:hypothetical protein